MRSVLTAADYGMLKRDAETLDMLDKELFRQGKDDEVIDAYEEVFNRLLTEEDKEKWGI